MRLKWTHLVPNPSNSDLVGEAKRLSEAATPGPWSLESETGGALLKAETSAGYCYLTDGEGFLAHRDAEFIARARTLLPELAQQLEQARAALREIVRREARSEYSSIYAAPGEFAAIARAALTPDEGAEQDQEEQGLANGA